MTAVTASAAEGDIWSINRIGGGDHGTETLSMAGNPVTAGQTVKFKFRMLNRDPEANRLAQGSFASADTWDNRWYFKYVGAGSSNEAAAAASMYPPKVGVWVSGRHQWANVESLALAEVNGTVNYNFTDLICSYTAQPGDFGLLTLAAGPESAPVEAAADNTDASHYCLGNRAYWGIYDKLTTTNACNFWLTSLTAASIAPAINNDFPTDDGAPADWPRDRDMSKAGIYIRTVDFDAATFNADGVWRRIAANGTSAYVNDGKVKRSPTLAVPGGVATDHTVTLYVWTEDESIAYMKDGADETFVTNDVSFTRKVARITLAPEDGETKEIPGGIFAMPDATNKTTTVYLSATPTNIFRAGILITNFVTRTILVGPPEPPSIVLLANGATDYTATASPDSEIVPISVTLEGVGDTGYTADLTVTVTNAMINSTEDPQTFIGLCATESSNPSDYGATATVTIPRGYTSALVYAFVKRAKIDDTTAADKGIRLGAAVDATAEAFFTGGIMPATLHVKADHPIIDSPAESTFFQHVPGGNDYTVKIKVRDAYGETGSGAKFTVYWSNAGNGIYTKYDNLSLVAGELTITTKYMTGGTFDTQFYVANQDAAADATPDSNFTSALRTIRVQVDEPKVISLAADRASRRYNEGEHAEITMTLSEDFSTAAVGYLFLVPQNEDSSNLVECVQYDNFRKGVPILAGTRTADPIEITFLDGKPSTLQYAAVLRSAEKIEDGDVIGGFATRMLTLSVSNVVPRVTKVAMGGTPFETNGGLHPTKVAQGVLTDFQLRGVAEPSELDRTNAEFTVEWSFYNQAGAQLYTTNTVGDPYADASKVQYAFPQSGTNSVTVRVKDKDTTTGQYANAELFTFRVETLGTPMISLVPWRGSKTFLETDTGADNGRIDVRLNMAPSEAITVEIKVAHADPSDTTMLPVLSTYYVNFASGATEGSFFLKELDGTDQAQLNGFSFTAAVTNETVAPNSGNKKWKDYYTFDPNGLTIYVMNVSPEIAGSNDNTITNVATLNVPYTIRWGVSDVMPDMTSSVPLKVSWNVPGEGIFDSDLTGVTSRSVTTNFTFTFTKQGATVRKVVLTVTDKDGGSASREYVFQIDPQKPVSVIPLGPQTKGQTPLSQRYARQPGRGEGRVWADGALSKIESFKQTWNYEPNNMVAWVFGYGYRAGETDDGSLQPVASLQSGTSMAITPAGNRATAAPYYPADTVFDSFFYCWIGTGDDGEEGGGSSEGAHLGPIAPAVGTNVLASAGQQKVSLATETKDEENPQYGEVTVEAVFSKELLAKDNVGDINADGIPDVFAVGFDWQGGLLFEAAGGTVEEGGDLLNLRNWNGDAVSTQIGQTASGDTGDFLPSMTSGGSGSLIPNIQSNWALYGSPFTAYLEIRGFGEGLNYRARRSDTQGPNTTGDWIGERDFTEVESNAWATIYGEDPNWTPENRTDPTVDDTDGDGLPDGYEYYFWYRAYVGDPETGDRLTGERFNLADISVGTPITSEEIAEAFNPNVRNAKPVNERDSDGDGLTDLEEFAIGTNPIHWDTDGDGLSDYWEVLRGLNPLVSEPADSNPDGDFMARVEIGTTYAVISFADADGHTRTYALPGDGRGLVDADALTVIEAATNNAVGIPVFRYGNATAPVVPTSRGIWAKSDKIASVAGSSYSTEYYEFSCIEKPTAPKPIDWTGLDDLSNVTVTVGQTLIVIHDQVLAEFGFDPRTAWFKNANNRVNNRWNDEEGEAVNTVPYTSTDEYLLLKYRYMTAAQDGNAAEILPGFAKNNPRDPSDKTYDLARDLAAIEAKKDTIGNVFLCGTTNPNIPFSKVYTEESGAEYADENHGADTSEDGVPDGWTLYVGFNPNAGARNNEKKFDGTGMGLAAQFAGTDSCAAYAGVETIYANLPASTTGWMNKFWPVNPWNGDTDGDCIRDDVEGGHWTGNYRFGQTVGFSYSFTFVYNETGDTKPTVSASTHCVRGGGMNPCSVDTDGDRLPDTWEMCYAGLLFTPDGTNGSLSGSALELIRRADGLTEGAAAKGYYIAGGMDATYSADAFGYATDPRTGTSRDFDFDQDGLQNFQEYLTQALRHLRYDDAMTPLMGRTMPDGTPASEKFLGFLQMNYMDGETFRAAAVDAGFTAFSSADYFRTLGYFARPARAWDPASVAGFTKDVSEYDGETGGYRIMLPPTALLGEGASLRAFGYASTDPRMWDSDGDNMDDYYELFHGLNPLLGSIMDALEGRVIVGDLICAAYGNNPLNISFWNNAWMGWPGPFGMPDWMGDGAYGLLDPLKYPWMMGTPEADADGDGIRNLEESLVVNMTSPQPTHTDPTPLWMTDSTAPNLASYTAQYYAKDKDLDLYWSFLPGTRQTSDGATEDFLFTFEENEGYDTDGDWIADSDEQIRTATQRSDALKFTDPDRRQAIWFPGEKSAAISKTGGSHRLNYQSYDTFRQFTVEAWIKPEAFDRAQTILERSAVYGASTMSNNVAQVRANFRIGITAEGYLYGSFDSNDAVATGTPGRTATALAGSPLTEGWTHVALSFDGTTLKLYMNGILMGSMPTGLIPANGLVDYVQDALPNMGNFPVLGNGYMSVPCAVVLGARALDKKAFEVSDKTTWASFDDFYAGYLDEVRVWDGARSAADIAADMKRRYSFADVSAQRDEVYSAWADGATRNDNDGKAMLPPELVMHYNFQTLPGATDAKYVAFEPSGFSKNVRNLCKIEGYNVPGDIYCGWWYLARDVRSTVYRNWRVVPWIQNTVGHLPPLDGSTVDSEYWSQWYGGLTAAGEVGVGEIVFPNTATPYPYVLFQADRYYHQQGLARKQALELIWGSVAKQYDFDLRTAVVGTSDLVPLGGAFAKRCEAMWDGQGAADAWALTLRDNDANGIPDWWEAVAKASYGAADGFCWDSIVTYDGREMTARDAYLRDLRKGMVPTGASGGAVDETFADRRIAADGISTWWKEFYGVTGGAYDDDDNDGLSNYHEWWLSDGGAAEGFGAANGFPELDPLNPRTLLAEGQIVPDYFLGLSGTGSQWDDIYFGFIATDHDFIEDWWEKQYANGYSNASVYDPENDWDEDGWTNYATARYQMWRNLFKSDLIDGWNVDGSFHLDYFPEPALAVRSTYFGVQDITSNQSHPQMPTIVTATRTSERTGRVDAKFIAVPSDINSADTGNSCNQYLGPYRAGAVMHGFLSPGCIVPTTLLFYKSDVGDADYKYWKLVWDSPVSGPNWNANVFTDIITNHYSGTLSQFSTFLRDHPQAQLEQAPLNWEPVATVVGDVQNRMGTIVHRESGVKLGVVDLHSGEYSFDLAELAKVDSKPAQLPSTVFMVAYASKIGNEWPQTLYYSNTKELDLSVEQTQRGVGHVMEGENVITSLIDLDGSGDYTPGEPFGVISGVDVGWHKVPEQVVELKDTSHVVPRFDLLNLADDRSVVRGAANSFVTYTGATLETAAKTAQIRITRTAINDVEAPNRIVLSKEYVLPDGGANSHARPFIHEGDVLTDGKYDLDWNWLAKDAVRLGIDNVRSASYEVSQRIILPDGSVRSVVLATFVNTFTSPRGRAVAESPRDGGTVFSASPTFTWTCTDDTLTAFDLQVFDANDNLVYDSGTQLLPGRVEGAYAFTPSLYADAPVTTNGAPVFADGSNYFWRVAMLNAKYNTAETDDASIWSAKKPFKMDLGHKQLTTGYGSANAVVRYYGPCGRKAKLTGTETGFDWGTGEVQDIAAGNGLVIVEAFENADFHGRPMAQIRLSDYTDLYCTTNNTKVNATLRGLDPGTLYFRAYIDQNNNGKRDPWESWGYANHVNTEWQNANGIRDDWEEWGNSAHYDGKGKTVSEAIYDPLGVVVTDSTSADVPTVVIYIEDCDVNRNNIPDSLEDVAGLSGESEADFDGDGLFDAEEGAYDTDIALWDSDGDGMPDGWEAKFADTDPMFKDADYAVAGDVMAYAVTNLTVITVWDGLDEASATNKYAVMGSAKVKMGDEVSARDDLRATYDYGGMYGLGREATASGYVYAVEENAEVALVHAQVYEFFGFDPYTANPAVEEADRVNTKAFTALDKYLVCRYLEKAYGLSDVDEAAMNTNGLWSSYTLKPGDPDNNRDGIPDGWELYVMFGPDGATATLGDAAVSPFELILGVPANAYVRDEANTPDGGGLAILDEFDGGNGVTDPWRVDTDGDGIPDGSAHAYGLVIGYDDDADGDGLSNYAEYLISEVYTELGIVLDSFSPSTDGVTPDYWRTVTVDGARRYLGELFTDHDHMDDDWEDAYDISYVNSAIWDAWADADGDGWSNWSEAMALTDPSLEAKLSLVSAEANEDQRLPEYPIPTVRMKVAYNGVSDAFNGKIVVKAWHGSALGGKPDASWTIGGPDNPSVSCSRFLGLNPNRVVSFNLGPGMIAEQHCSLTFFDPREEHWQYNDAGGVDEIVRYHIDTAHWHGCTDPAWNDDPTVQPNGSTSAAFGYGSVDYRTGDVTIDFTKLQDSWYGISVGDNEVAYLDLRRAFVRVNWMSRVVTKGNVKEFHLSLPDEDASTLGFLREGKTTFVVFADANGNGQCDAGEPYGFVRDVDVGWDEVPEVPVLLTDDDAGLRFAVDGEGIQRVRVVRTAINGVESRPRIVWSRKVDLDVRNWFAEADFMGSGAYDFDWAYLCEDAAKLAIAPDDIQSATYAVLVADSSSVVASFSRTFDAVRAKPVVVSPSAAAVSQVYTVRPEFRWTGSNDMTAFQLQIAKDADFTEIVWDSGTNFLSVSGNRAWKAPVYVGEQLEDGANYFWRVAEMNAKHQSPEDFWSDPAEFHTRVNCRGLSHEVNEQTTLDTGYSGLELDVRYYGPSTADMTNVVVGVYENADFTGLPAARLRLAGDGTVEALTNKTQAALAPDTFYQFNTNNAGVVTFAGLAPGSYYAMAFIDLNTNGVRDAYEPWGYVKDETGINNRQHPGTRLVKSGVVTLPHAVIVMEDTDVNGNDVPDSLEDLTIFMGTAGPGTSGGSSGDVSPDATRDSDGDGLSDSVEENEFGTESSSWDTDGDGMPDGWEAIFAGTDPLTDDPDDGIVRDVMAYAVTNLMMIVTWDGENEISATNRYILLDHDAKVNVGDPASNFADSLALTYDYGGKYGLGRAANPAALDSCKVYSVETNVEVVLVHAQVYKAFGFDPTTANPAAVDGSSDAVVTYSFSADSVTVESSGGVVYGANTKAFTALDKYLLCRYLEQACGLEGIDEVAMNTNGMWAACTLKPGDPDNDKDGLPDGWELYVMFGPDGTTATLDDAAISPFRYDDARTVAPGAGSELTVLEEFGGGTAVTDPWNSDTDGDGISDSDAHRYGLVGESDGDVDNDGLSNYMEYLISKILEDKGYAALDAFNAYSWGQAVPDYFLPAPDASGRYLGFVYGDHDFIDDWWEDQFDPDYVSSFAFDPWADLDDDGWSNWSEARAGTDPTQQNVAGVDGYVEIEHPVPNVTLTLVQEDGTSDAPIYVTAFPDGKVDEMPDAKWTLGGEAASERYLGANPKVGQTVTLGPCEPGSVHISMKTPVYFNHTEVVKNKELQKHDITYSLMSEWIGMISDKPRAGDLEVGDMIWAGMLNHPVGWINYRTGELYINYALAPEAEFVRESTETETHPKTNAEGGDAGADVITTSKYKEYPTDGAWFLARWQSVLPAGTWRHTVYLGTPEPAALGVSRGALREGKTTFVAFLDENSDGAWTPGEPYGVVTGVDVGWFGTSCEIELKRTASQVVRMNMPAVAGTTDFNAANDLTDRRVVGAPTAANIGSGLLSAADLSTRKVRMRILRTLVNGERFRAKAVTAHGAAFTYDEVVYDHNVDLATHPLLTEANVLTAGMCDLDWGTLPDAWLASGNGSLGGLTNVAYRIVLGEGSDMLEDGNGLPLMFVNTFESGLEQTVAVPIEPAGTVHAARPTFRWTHPNAIGKEYPAFRLRVWNLDDDTKPIYDSGVQPAPTHTDDGVYEWTAPLCAGMVTPEGVVFGATNRYAWTVSMLDAKYVEPNASETRCRFQMGVDGTVAGGDSDYGALNVCVRYYGPVEAKAVTTSPTLGGAVTEVTNIVRVQAFTTPDFTGDPAGEGYVTNVTDLASLTDVTTANARIRGLKPGAYYVRAFIDSDADSFWSRWETWGYANYVGDENALYLYTPRATTVTAGAAAETVTVYMEDMDTNLDGKSDADDFSHWGAIGTSSIMVTGADGTPFVPETNMLEDGSLTNGWLNVTLRPAPSDLNTTVTVTLSVTRPLGEGTEWPTFSTSAGTALPYVETETETGVARAYTLANVSDATTRVFLGGLDGTDLSVYAVKVSADAADLYDPGEFRFMVTNVAPVIGPVAYGNDSLTNAATVRLGDAFTIPVTVDDVAADLAAGLTVVWRGDDLFSADGTAAIVTGNAFVSETNGEAVVTERVNRGFAFMFAGGRSGLRAVTLTVTDKDGGVAERTYWYYVIAPQDDFDNDGLANWIENCIKDGFAVDYASLGYKPVSYTNMYSTAGQAVPDYFLRVGSTYLGFLFADHDFIDDWWEDLFDPDYVSRYVFDAWDDPDQDGWGNYAEARVGTDPTQTTTMLLDSDAQFEGPTPTIRLKAVYPNVKAAPITANLVVQAYGDRESYEHGAPNAVWSVPVASAQTLMRNLGVNPGGVVRLNLGPGSVKPGSVSVEFRDPNTLSHTAEGENVWLDAVGSTWVKGLTEYFVPGETPLLVRITADDPVGTIDYETGDVVMDLARMQDYLYESGNLHSFFEPDGSNEWIRVNLAKSYVRVRWDGQMYSDGRKWETTLSAPNVSGHLREGKTMFVVFADTDGNNLWTPGEPYGVATDVDVGWAGTSVEVELTDVSSRILRMDLEPLVNAKDKVTADAATDRGVLSDYAYYPNEGTTFYGTNDIGKVLVRMRIVRSWFNGENTDPVAVDAANGTVFEGMFDLRGHPRVTEADLLAKGLLDLDWGTLHNAWRSVKGSDASVNGLTNVAYRILLGNGTDSGALAVLDNLTPIVFYNAFELGMAQTRTEPVAPAGIVASAQPTFCWKHEAKDTAGRKIKDYPAFRLRVWKQDGTTLVYDSGNLPAPPRSVVDGSYSWTAPIYANMVTPQGQIFATTNNYKWAVSMLDAKFTTPNTTETKMEFRLETSGALGTISDYGALKACVRYYGPAKVTATASAITNLIRVQAFASPDFTGMPAGETYVKSVAGIASTTDVTTPNALILGLKPGTYYLRAFIDSDGDCAWSKWETWGYANYVNTDATSLYAPRAVTVGLGAPAPEATIYMEDMDTDKDGLPDAKEWNDKSSLAARTAPTGNTFFTRVNPNFASTVKRYAFSDLPPIGPLGIGSPSVGVALLSAPPPVANALTAPDAVQVTIDSFSLADGVSLKVSSSLTPGEYGAIVVNENATVDLYLVAAKTPDFADAREVLAKTITIKANEAREVVTAAELKALIETAGLGDAAFFKVRLQETE